MIWEERIRALCLRLHILGRRAGAELDLYAPFPKWANVDNGSWAYVLLSEAERLAFSAAS